MNFSNLNKREQLFLLIGGLFVIGFLIWLGVVAPYRKSIDKLQSKIASRQQQLVQVRSLQQEFNALLLQTAEVDRRAGQGHNFSLIAFVEAEALKIASRDHLVYLRPQPGAQAGELREESLELKLEKIRLDQLVKLLYAAETADSLLKVKSLRSKARFDDPTLLDVVMVISSYGKAG